MPGDQYDAILPFRPSSGIEGENFIRQWCNRCRRNNIDRKTGMRGCRIQAATFIYHIGEAGYPDEWIVENGIPRCTGFVKA
ncbi:MAG: hypothetical protein ACU833_07040 [Gammaproteobacteria bacterium]